MLYSASAKPTPPALNVRPAAIASSARSSLSKRERFASRRGAERADRELAVQDGRPGRRRGAGEFDARDALARGSAMLHARDDLLADIAALVEIDPMEKIEIGVVREGVRIGEIEAALGRADGDAKALVFADVLRSDRGGDSGAAGSRASPGAGRAGRRRERRRRRSGARRPRRPRRRDRRSRRRPRPWRAACRSQAAWRDRPPAPPSSR